VSRDGGFAKGVTDLPLRLNLGSGDHPTIAGWVAIDARPDCQYPPDLVGDVLHLPYPDGSCDRLYAGHLLEHIPLPLIEAALGEWRRLLVPGGELGIVGPDIDRAVLQGEPAWLLAQIVRSSVGGPPAGHAWTQSACVLEHLITREGWRCEEVPVTALRPPEWPNPNFQALWQCAFICRP